MAKSLAQSVPMKGPRFVRRSGELLLPSSIQVRKASEEVGVFTLPSKAYYANFLVYVAFKHIAEVLSQDESNICWFFYSQYTAAVSSHSGSEWISNKRTVSAARSIVNGYAEVRIFVCTG